MNNLHCNVAAFALHFPQKDLPKAKALQNFGIAIIEDIRDTTNLHCMVYEWQTSCMGGQALAPLSCSFAHLQPHMNSYQQRQVAATA